MGRSDRGPHSPEPEPVPGRGEPRGAAAEVRGRARGEGPAGVQGDGGLGPRSGRRRRRKSGLLKRRPRTIFGAVVFPSGSRAWAWAAPFNRGPSARASVLGVLPASRGRGRGRG